MTFPISSPSGVSRHAPETRATPAHDVRLALIASGIIVPGSPAAWPGYTPQGWLDAPTLRLDRVGALAAEQHQRTPVSHARRLPPDGESW